MFIRSGVETKTLQNPNRTIKLQFNDIYIIWNWSEWENVDIFKSMKCKNEELLFYLINENSEMIKK